MARMTAVLHSSTDRQTGASRCNSRKRSTSNNPRLSSTRSLQLQLPWDHRPDSPTSLEDSQSDSGVDPFVIEPTTAKWSMASCPNDPLDDAAQLCDPASPKQTTAVGHNHGLVIHTDAASTAPISRSQVATPPLSPIKSSDEHDLKDEHPRPPAPSHASARPSAWKTIVVGPHKDNDMGRNKRSISSGLPNAHVGKITSMSGPSSAWGVTPQPVVPSPVPKVSAWSTLLPGVAPIPIPTPSFVPKPTISKSIRTPTQGRSQEWKLHERFPIILPYESEVKLSMDMTDLFEASEYT